MRHATSDTIPLTGFKSARNATITTRGGIKRIGFESGFSFGPGGQRRKWSPKQFRDRGAGLASSHPNPVSLLCFLLAVLACHV
jgi:hypothetical protein